MSLSPGDKLGPYEILELLGAGGMGQVWKARDTRLNRTVAIKTNNKGFTERSRREAQAIAALNHPNICTLYDVGPDYLVMEYVEGKPIQGPLPVGEVLQNAGQILDALDAAHRKGITHRDLKPGNILRGPNGVKVLDFGLAKFERASPGSDDVTLTAPLTSAGTIMGTLNYMAPEQLEGKEADSRSDIFSFGVVLYELISGKRPFNGATQANLLAAILRDPPEPLPDAQLRMPAGLERVLQTCLEKDPEKRWQSAREIKHALEWTSQITTAAPAAGVAAFAPVPARKFPVWPIAAALIVVAAIGAAAWTFWPQPAAAPAAKFQVSLPDNAAFGQYVSVSPDGRKLVFNASGEAGGFWIRDLDSLEWRKLEGTQNAVSPFWSPDSKFLAFGVTNQLKKINVAGGPAQLLTEVPFPAGSGVWTREGVILFGGRGGGSIFKVSQAGGAATAVTLPDTSRGEAFHGLPSLLPGEKTFIYLRNGGPDVIGMYRGSIDAGPESQSKERFLAGPFAASYVGGYLFFMRDKTLMAQSFDVNAMKLTGEPLPVAEGVATTGSIGVFSASAGGALAYRGGTTASAFQFTWLDRQGKETGVLGQRTFDRQVRLSPDGKRGVVRDAAANSIGDLWTLDFARGVRTRLTFRQSAGTSGVWSPDGSRIIFAAGPLVEALYEKSSSGVGEEKELIRESGKILQPTSWSRDGKFLLYGTASLGTGAPMDVFALPLEGDRKPVSLLATPAPEGDAVFSPDMRWLAYSSAESGRSEVYVRPFLASGPSLGEGKWQISRDGGWSPAWRADGKEIVFEAPPNRTVKMAVEVNGAGSAFEAGVPQRLFQNPAGAPDLGWAITADAKRFLISLPGTQGVTQTPITVILNWQAQLKK